MIAAQVITQTAGVQPWVTIMLAVLTISLPVAAFFAATRATRSQAKASVAAANVAVDADAYLRAKEIYEAAIDTMKEEVEDLRKQVEALKGEVAKLHQSSMDLAGEVVRWRTTAAKLRAQLPRDAH